MPLDRTRLLDAYRVMRTIRTVEQTLHELSLAGRVPGFLHLYAGEEAVAAGVCAHLGAVDTVTSTHRGHGHAIARGIDLGAMMAELFGRRDGVCRGKGGTMHVADTDKGMLGANGIVGGGIPLAVGAALSARSGAPVASPWPSSATAPPTRGSSTRASTSPPCSCCPWCSCARTTATARPPRSNTTPACATSPCAPPATACRAWSSTAWTSLRCTPPPPTRSCARAGARARRSSSARPTATSATTSAI